MSYVIRSEIKHDTCTTATVLENIAESIRVNPNGETECPVCGLTDSNLKFQSMIEFDNGYILERLI